MRKIKVTPEGRPNIWIPEKDSLKLYIRSTRKKLIHHYFGDTQPIFVGADHETKSVLEDIDKAERLAVFTDRHSNLGHSLAVIINNRLHMFDIGQLTMDNLEVE